MVSLQVSTMSPREVVDLAELTASERAALAQELFEVHRQVFAGLSFEEFTAYVFHSKALATRIRVFRTPDGRPVGYCAAHRYRRVFNGEQSTIIRAEAGLLRAYRGHVSTWSFGISQAIRYKLLHPLDPTYYLGMLVHPSSYCLLAERFPEIHPSRRQPTRPELLQAMVNLADSFGVPAVGGAPLIRDVGWITRQTSAEAEFWASSSHPDVQYFLALNPGYRAGRGLVTLVPLTLVNLIGSMTNHMALAFRHALSSSSATRHSRSSGTRVVLRRSAKVD